MRAVRRLPAVESQSSALPAFENRRIARRGGDPLADRRKSAAPTFAEAAEATVAVLREGWKAGGRQEQIWRRAVNEYAMPRLGKMRVDTISATDIVAVLSPHWQGKHETARRVRQRIGAVMKWAQGQGFREDNPVEAASAALPKPSRVVEHMKALPHGEVAGALATVATSRAWWATKAAFAFMVHTAARSGEVRGATWAEMDLEGAVWTVPPERSKIGREHRVPLSPGALKVLEAARDMADSSGLVFPSITGKQLSDSTISKLLREAGVQAVPHGFRSSFRDWAGETGIPREVAEQCLMHVVGGAVERAYSRSDLFRRRREAMAAWGAYLAA